MIEKAILFIPILLIGHQVHGQSDPFKELQYDRVIAYEYDGTGARTIDHCLERQPSLIEQDRILSKEEILTFETIITATGAYGAVTAACFDPHLAVVYYLNNAIIAKIEVCLSCNYLDSSLDIPSTREKMVDIGTDYSRPLIGFSTETRRKLDDFLVSIGFMKYRIEEGSIFDE